MFKNAHLPGRSFGKEFPAMAMAMMSWMLAIPVLGFMTGARSMMPMCILCWFAYKHHVPLHNTWAFWCENKISVIVFTVLAAGELVGDKLPMTPNRTAVFPLIARVCFGGLVGAIGATALHGAALEGILLGAISALAGTFAGFYIRSWIVTRFNVPDLPVALLEDVVVIGSCVLAMGIITG